MDTPSGENTTVIGSYVGRHFRAPDDSRRRRLPIWQVLFMDAAAWFLDALAVILAVVFVVSILSWLNG